MSINAGLLAHLVSPCECCGTGCDCGCVLDCPRHRPATPGENREEQDR